MMSRILFRLLVLFPVACLGGQWPLPPTTISTPGVNASSPCAAVNLNGNIIALWLENGTVMASSTVPKAAWSSPVVVSGSGADSPQVVIDANGNATAIWAENGIIKVATKPLAGGWSTSTILSGSGASSPQIGVDSSGDLVAVWLENGVVMSSTQLFGGSWNATPDTLSLSSNASYPGLAVNASGAVIAAWQQPVGSTPSIFVAQKQIGGSWVVAQMISSEGVNSVYPHVAIDASGNAIAVWFKYQFANNQYSNVFLQAAQQTAGQAWGVPVNVSLTKSSKNPADLSAALAYNGIASPVVTWTSSDDGATFSINQAIFSGGAWTMHPPLLENNWGVYSVSLGISAIGNNGTVWMRSDPVSGNLVIEGTTTTYHGFESLVWARWVFSNSGNNAYPLTIVGGTSSAPAGVLIWEHYDGSNTSIQTQTSALKVVQPPTGVSVVQQGTNLGVLIRYDNVITWTPSSSKNLWGYLIERNNLPLVLLNSNTFSYIDLNQDLNAPVIYQISTIDINGFQSDWATVSFP